MMISFDWKWKSTFWLLTSGLNCTLDNVKPCVWTVHTKAHQTQTLDYQYYVKSEYLTYQASNVCPGDTHLR